MNDNGISVDWLSGLCPVQAEGTVDGHQFYFKARGNRWDMWIALEADQYEPDLGFMERTCFMMGAEYGVFPQAGYMPDEDVYKFIQQAADVFRVRKTVAR